MRLIDYTGKRYGKLVILERAENQLSGTQERRVWKAQCDCGEIKLIKAQALGHARSCGCLQREAARQLAIKRNTTHGNYYHECANMYYAAKQRAKRKGLPFAIEIADISIPEKCPLLGIKLEKGIKGFNPNSPSLDKIVPELGYVKGNVWVISMRANTIKQNASLEELQELTKSLERKIQEQEYKLDVFIDGREVER